MPIRSLLPWTRTERNLPIRRETEDAIITLRREMDRLFDDFFRSPFSLRPFEWFGSAWGEFSPCVDIQETDKAVEVYVDLPGMDEKDIQISLGDNILTISGEKKAEKEEKGKRYYHLERSYGSFYRSIPVPVEIDEDKAEATFDKGVLKVVLPKTAEAQKRAKKIPIKKV